MNNIPAVPPEGWTPSYLRQLRTIAETIQPPPAIEEHRWLVETFRGMPEDQRDELFDATIETFREWQRVEQISLDDRGSPQKHIDKIVADNRHRCDDVAAARRLFDRRTPGVQPQDVESDASQLALL